MLNVAVGTNISKFGLGSGGFSWKETASNGSSSSMSVVVVVSRKCNPQMRCPYFVD